MVAHAPQAEAERRGIRQCLGRGADLFHGIPQRRAVPGLCALRDDRRAVIADPAERLSRQVAEPLVRAAEYIAVVPRAGKYLHQSPRMTERVEVDGGCGFDTELLPEVAPPLGDLADERLAAGHIAVGLDVPAAHDMPLAQPHQFPDLPEQGGIILLNPAVYECFVMAEDVVVKLPAETRRAPEGGDCRGTALLPFPLPDGVKVCIADKMHRFVHSVSPFRFSQILFFYGFYRTANRRNHIRHSSQKLCRGLPPGRHWLQPEIMSGKVLRGLGDSFKSPPAFPRFPVSPSPRRHTSIATMPCRVNSGTV